jgi:hypothetical protein
MNILDALDVPLPKPAVWVNLPWNRRCKSRIKPGETSEFLSESLPGLWFRQECEESLLLVAGDESLDNCLFVLDLCRSAHLIANRRRSSLKSNLAG